MLRDKVRSCDVCGSEIAKGERYVVSKIPKHQIGIVEELMAATEPEMRPTMEMDSQGNLRLDICTDCRMNMSVPGNETIN